MRAGDLLPARPQCRGPSGASPGANWPRATRIGHHTYSHPLLDHDAARQGGDRDQPRHRGRRIARSMASAAAGRPPFFRFPGFASSPALLDRLNERGIVVFGADVWASDWLPMTPEQELQPDPRAHRAGRAAASCCFTTPRQQTAQMLPAFLRALKQRGFRIVHVVAAAKPRRNPTKSVPFLPQLHGKSTENEPVERSYWLIFR